MNSGTLAVVGAEGFIGTALSVACENRGFDVRKITRRNPVFDLHGNLNPGLLDCDSVIWLASQTTPAVAAANPATAAAELAEIEKAVTAISSSSEAQSMIFASSGGTVYKSSCAPPFSESSPTEGATPYSRMKLSAERSIGEFRGASVVVRLANPYGPGQKPRQGQGVVAHWAQSIALGRSPVVIGDARTARDYVYISDVIDFFVLLLERVVSHGLAVPPVLNIGSGSPVSLASLIAIFQELVDVQFEFQPSRGFDNPSTWLSNELALTHLNWRPLIGMREGIARTLDWWGVRTGPSL